ncbi:MAG: hypothetical protein IJW06_03280 [Clostridia bacterium]|nr:hypothetical protein [Clostridia bacterium]
MKKILITLLASILLLSVIGCNKTPPDVSNNTDKITEQNSVDEQLLHMDDYDEFLTEIYLCDDVYRSDDTPTHGSGAISLPLSQDVLEVKDYDILLCGDGCSPESVVSRASQGYAPAYHVVSDGEIDGNFKVLKFKMEIPEPMIEDIKKQGVYKQITEEIESQYYYLLVLDERHYAYIHLERKEGVERIEDEAELADSIIKNARVNFEPKNEKLDLTLERVTRLAENHGEELTWEDFKMYNAIETGSGLYILVYEIDETFDLMIGGVPNSSPMYIRLVTKADRGNYIDIRTEDVERFISENREKKSESEYPEKVYSRVTEISQLPEAEENAIVTGAVVGGFTKFYCFSPGLKYYRFDLGTRKYYECELYLQDGYKNGEIIHIRAGAGSGEAEIFIKANDKNGNTVYPAYNFGAAIAPLDSQPSSIVIHNEQELIKYGINTEILCKYPKASYFTPISLKSITKEEVDETKCHIFIEEESEYTQYLLLMPSEKLSDISLTLMELTDEGLAPGERLHTLDKLDLDKPLIVGVVFYGDFTTYGLSFKSASGNERNYIIYTSGKDGSVILQKYEQDNQ